MITVTVLLRDDINFLAPVLLVYYINTEQTEYVSIYMF